ncbi:hypothetical protein [Halococcus agarilyticus]|uniref:hypothetical protein n=1 Tax=Halococcus agarilyticus TaxID=1232219 RepID=UPI000677DCE0|nr:hypothetical protein [Halococcus agarilyticus]
MDRATGVAAATAVVYALVMLAVGLWMFRGDAVLLGAVVFVAVVLAPPCYLITRSAVRAQLPETN